MLVKLFEDILHKLIFREFAGNVILFQTKVFGKNIKETTVARYFMKVTVRSSFTRLKLIRRINGIH